jgi:hypothetical protein
MSDAPDESAAVERALMDRFRDRANHVPEKPPRRLLQHAIALLLSVAIVLLVLTGFDRFLTSVQKFMEIGAREDAPAAAAPAPTDPIPAFVVPAEVSPPPPADQDPRPSPPRAPDNAPASPR